MSAVAPSVLDMRSLDETTFCVVDLETTGGSPAGGAAITEIGAVLTRGGCRIGEFQTLVYPGQEIPPFISALTGITDEMVREAPTIEFALPDFLEFAAGAVLVAHNAPFDLGFLRHFARREHLDWPDGEVIDTVLLARRVLTRAETPNCKLASLAAVFGAGTMPNHRALDDARATADVLWALLQRADAAGIRTIEELAGFTGRGTPPRQRHDAHDALGWVS